MRRLSLRLAAVAGLSIAIHSSLAAQQPVDSARPMSGGGSANRFATLPYGANDDKPVSRWTPPASAGRQLTLNDLLTWKSIRNASISNDGKWFAYILGPNEGDAEVVIRGTAAGSKELRFPVGDAAALNRGGPPGTRRKCRSGKCLGPERQQQVGGVPDLSQRSDAEAASRNRSHRRPSRPGWR